MNYQINNSDMKFNVFQKKRSVTNYEGAKAYMVDDRTALYSAVVTTGLNDKFYESADKRVERIRELIVRNDSTFVGKLAIYARTKMNLRSVPLVLAVELAKNHNGSATVGKVVEGVVKRADEITELLAYYQSANTRVGTKRLNKLSKQIQHGLVSAFNSFDEYQFAKYNRAGQIKLKDALFIVHPKPKNEAQQSIFNKIVSDTLDVPYTWETELSSVGQKHFSDDREKEAAVRVTWERLVTSGKLGYMAMLRNLRNMIAADVSTEVMAEVCSTLSSRDAVVRSKQLPFRFLSAYREVKALTSGVVPMVLDALEEAVTQSAANIRGFDANTSVVIACDVSGSMQNPVSPKSKVMNYDIGLMLAMLLQSRCANVRTGMFGDTWKVISTSRKNVLANVQEFYKREGEVGYATNGYLVIMDLITRLKKVDKVFMFTDCQLWNSNVPGFNMTMSSVWKKYKYIAPQAKLYLFDLAGYGNTPVDVKSDDVFLIAGWSDKIFDVLAALEDGGDALAEIDKIVL